MLCDIFYSSACKGEPTGEDDKATPSNLRWRVPLPNATLKQATRFLEFIYSQGEPGLPEKHLAMDDVHSMIELLHRLDCTLALQKIDVYLAREADYDTYKPKDSVVTLLHFGTTCLGASFLQLVCVPACMQGNIINPGVLQ